MNIIEVKGLVKKYDRHTAVKGIDFSVRKGTLFAFLGPNGAGKSTTIDILCTLLAQTSGEVLIGGKRLGKDDDAIRKMIGVVFQESLLDKLLTVRENLTIRAKFYGLKGEALRAAVLNAATSADVMPFLDRPYGKLSGGQRRRADIARALVNTPQILFLDEPTTGLDPKTKEGVWEMITKLQRETGMTVFLTTHYMEEAAMADDIVLIDKGKIAVMGTPYELKSKYSEDVLRIKPSHMEAFIKGAEDLGLVFTEQGGVFTAPLKATKEAIAILRALEAFIESFEVVHGSMNDVFLNITGGALNA